MQLMVRPPRLAACAKPGRVPRTAQTHRRALRRLHARAACIPALLPSRRHCAFAAVPVLATRHGAQVLSPLAATDERGRGHLRLSGGRQHLQLGGHHHRRRADGVRGAEVQADAGCAALLRAFKRCALTRRAAFPADYPFKAPTVRFDTPCFHPNVDQVRVLRPAFAPCAFAAPSSYVDTPPWLERQHLPGHSEGEVERRAQRAHRAALHPVAAGRCVRLALQIALLAANSFTHHRAQQREPAEWAGGGAVGEPGGVPASAVGARRHGRQQR